MKVKEMCNRLSLYMSHIMTVSVLCEGNYLMHLSVKEVAGGEIGECEDNYTVNIPEFEKHMPFIKSLEDMLDLEVESWYVREPEIVVLTVKNPTEESKKKDEWRKIYNDINATISLLKATAGFSILSLKYLCIAFDGHNFEEGKTYFDLGIADIRVTIEYIENKREIIISDSFDIYDNDGEPIGTEKWSNILKNEE